jgi:hypothetical protein
LAKLDLGAKHVLISDHRAILECGALAHGFEAAHQDARPKGLLLAKGVLIAKLGARAEIRFLAKDVVVTESVASAKLGVLAKDCTRVAAG